MWMNDKMIREICTKKNKKTMVKMVIDGVRCVISDQWCLINMMMNGWSGKEGGGNLLRVNMQIK